MTDYPKTKIKSCDRDYPCVGLCVVLLFSKNNNDNYDPWTSRGQLSTIFQPSHPRGTPSNSCRGRRHDVYHLRHGDLRGGLAHGRRERFAPATTYSERNNARAPARHRRVSDTCRNVLLFGIRVSSAEIFFSHRLAHGPVRGAYELTLTSCPGIDDLRTPAVSGAPGGHVRR